jgi:hypothetical protein
MHGTSLVPNSTKFGFGGRLSSFSGKVSTLASSWEGYMSVGAGQKRPKIREIVADVDLQATASRSDMSVQDIASLLSPLTQLPSGVFAATVSVADAAGKALDIKSEAKAEQVYSRPYADVARALILALVSLGYPLTILFDTPSGAVIEAKLTVDFWSLGGTLSFVISEEHASSVRVSGTSTISGQRFAWGKGQRALADVIQKTGEYLNLLAP